MVPHPLMYREDDPLLRRVRELPEPGDGDALAQDPRTWVPAYLGPSGWLGINLDRPDTDWDEVAELLDASYRRVARATLLARLDGA